MFIHHNDATRNVFQFSKVFAGPLLGECMTEKYTKIKANINMLKKRIRKWISFLSKPPGKMFYKNTTEKGYQSIGLVNRTGTV